jgi:hypothetical protein
VLRLRQLSSRLHNRLALFFRSEPQDTILDPESLHRQQGMKIERPNPLADIAPLPPQYRYPLGRKFTPERRDFKWLAAMSQFPWPFGSFYRLIQKP